jgi:hypothetical protein
MNIEEESGTSTSGTHPHRGYYAGDFVAPVPNTLVVTSQPYALVRLSGPSDKRTSGRRWS